MGYRGAHEPLIPFLRAGPFPGPLWGQIMRHFVPLSSGLLESGSIAKMPVFSYMEIIAEKVLLWGKVISFLQGGEPGFLGGGAVMWAAGAPPPGSASARKCSACPPGVGGGGSWQGASGASVWPRGWGPAAPMCPGVDACLWPWRPLPLSRPCWPQAVSPPRASVSSSANCRQPSWLC